MTKRDGKQKASITIPRCPHCEQGAGYTKNRGAYHVFEHEGDTIKLYHVTCKACDKVYTLREAWPTSTAGTAEE